MRPSPDRGGLSRHREAFARHSLDYIHNWTHQNFLLRGSPFGKRAESVPDRRCRVVLAPAEDLPFLEAITLAYQAGFVEPILVGDLEKILVRKVRQVRQVRKDSHGDSHGDSNGDSYGEIAPIGAAYPDIGRHSPAAHKAENSDIKDPDWSGGLRSWQTFHEPDPLKAVAKAASLIKQGQADVLMRGHILAYDFFKVLLHSEQGLRKDRPRKGRLIPTSGGIRPPQFWSQVGVIQIPNFPRLLIISDCGLNVNPGVDEFFLKNVLTNQ